MLLYFSFFIHVFLSILDHNYNSCFKTDFLILSSLPFLGLFLFTDFSPDHESPFAISLNV